MKVVFITGASRGIGKAIAERLLEEEDHIVYNISRSHTIDHKRCSFIKCDLSDLRSILELRFPERELESVTLINNAAVLGEVKHIGNLDSSLIASTHLCNIVSPHILLNEFVKTYRDINGRKLVLNITSGAATSPYDGWSVYCASKSALNMLTQVFHAEVNNRNDFKVLAIAPGVVQTAMQEDIRQLDPSEFSKVEKFRDLHKEGKLYEARDVANRIVEILFHPELQSELISRIVL